MDGNGLAAFTDAAGNRWHTSINFGVIRHVKEKIGFDLTELATREGLEKVTGDMFLFADLVWWIVEPQATPKGITSDQFFAALLDDHLTHAIIAVQNGLADFFPRDRGAILRMIASKETRAVEMANRRASTALAELMKPENLAKMDAQVDQELAKLFGDSAGDSAASSASNPGV